MPAKTRNCPTTRRKKMKSNSGAGMIFRVLSIVFYVLAAILFFMRDNENGFTTYAVISLAIGAVFSSVSAAIALKNKEKNDEDDDNNTDK